MFTDIISGIKAAVEREEKFLRSLPQEIVTGPRNCQERTIKMILGHLIDSASNNHQRMVRLQYSVHLLVFPDYRQDNDLWIAIQDYQHADWENMLQLWRSFNLHICEVMASVNKSKLNSYWCDFEGTKVTLEEMINGYLDHLNLHIREIHSLAEGRDISVCGADCGNCTYLPQCKGCNGCKGAVFYCEGKECPIHSCVKSKSLKNCIHCSLYPCALYLNMRDPKMSDKEFEESLAKRKENMTIY